MPGGLKTERFKVTPNYTRIKSLRLTPNSITGNYLQQQMAPAPSNTFSKSHATPYPCLFVDLLTAFNVGETKNQFNPFHEVRKSSTATGC
jgi:hypothetical protein